MNPTIYAPPRRSAIQPANKCSCGLSGLTPDNAALIVVDYQVGPLWELEFGVMRRRAVDLVTTARRSAVPTIFAASDPDEYGPIIPELTRACPHAPIVVLSGVNAWEGGLREAVASTGRSSLVVVGAATKLTVALCALAAADDGYDTYVVFDAPGPPIEGSRRLRDRVLVASFSLVAAAL
jgi:nicotinamidase-related amidase